jgi:hypothetical protein
MGDSNRLYDVLIAHAPAELAVAREVAATCRLHGLTGVAAGDLEVDPAAADLLREAVSESWALVLILSPAGVTPTMTLLLGAAQAWEKPVFAILTDANLDPVPTFLADIPRFPVWRVAEVIRAVRQTGETLSDADRSHLTTAYAKLGVSVDDLTDDPARLDRLAKQFANGSGKTVPGERLLSELLRMRKQGRLVRSRLADRPGHQKGTA